MKYTFSILIAFCAGFAICGAMRSTSGMVSSVSVGTASEASIYIQDALAAEKLRKDRLISEAEFASISTEPGVIILDPRGRSFYASFHVKGAVNLPFTHFDPESLKETIPGKECKILIYCRNNFATDFLRESGRVPSFEYPVEFEPPQVPKGKGSALTIPVFITLFQNGYKNVWELRDVVDPADSAILFVGARVQQSAQ